MYIHHVLIWKALFYQNIFSLLMKAETYNFLFMNLFNENLKVTVSSILSDFLADFGDPI